MLRSINPAAAAIALLLFIVPQANLSFANEACEIDLSGVNPVSHDTALEELKAIGFVSLSENGTRYSIESAQSSAATEILRWIASLDPAAKNAAPLKFYLQVA